MASISALGDSTNRLTGSVLKEMDITGDAFLQMMIAQMKNQNPLDPMKNETFMTQLATFAQLEQLVTLNTQISSMISFGAMSTINSHVKAYDPFFDVTVEGTVTGVKLLNNQVFVTIDNTVDMPWSQVVEVTV